MTRLDSRETNSLRKPKQRLGAIIEITDPIERTVGVTDPQRSLGGPATGLSAGFARFRLSEVKRISMDPSGCVCGGWGVDGVACRAPTASAGLNVGLFPFIAWIQHSLSPAQLPGVRHHHPNHDPRQLAQPGTGHASEITRNQKRRRVFSAWRRPPL